MTNELVVSILEKLNEEGLLMVYDNEGNDYEVDWIFSDVGLCIKIKK